MDVNSLESVIQNLESSGLRGLIHVDEIQMIRIQLEEIVRQLNVNVAWINAVRQRIVNIEVRLNQLWLACCTSPPPAADSKNTDANANNGTESSAAGGGSNQLPKTVNIDVPIAPQISPFFERPVMKITKSDGPNGYEISQVPTTPWQKYVANHHMRGSFLMDMDGSSSSDSSLESVACYLRGNILYQGEPKTQNVISLPGDPIMSARALNSNHVPTIRSLSPISLTSAQSTVSVQQPNPFDQEIEDAMDKLESEFELESATSPLNLTTQLKKRPDTPPLNLSKPSGLSLKNGTPLSQLSQSNWAATATPVSFGSTTLVFDDGEPLSKQVKRGKETQPQPGPSTNLASRKIFHFRGQNSRDPSSDFFNASAAKRSPLPKHLSRGDQNCLLTTADTFSEIIAKIPAAPTHEDLNNQMAKITVTSPSLVKEDAKANWLGITPRLGPDIAIGVSGKDVRRRITLDSVRSVGETPEDGRQSQQQGGAKKRQKKQNEQGAKKKRPGMDGDENRPEGSAKKLKASMCAPKFYHKPPSAKTVKAKPRTKKRSNKRKVAYFTTPLPNIGPPISDTLTAAVRLAEAATFPTSSGNATARHAANTSISSAALSKWFESTSDGTTSNQEDDEPPVITIDSDADGLD